MADVLKLSWLNSVRGMYVLDFFSNDIARYGDARTPNLPNITLYMNHLYLDNGLLKEIIKIDGLWPSFKDKNGEIISQMHPLYNTLSHKENIDFIVQRMKECEILPTGLIAENSTTEQQQFMEFCQLAKIFMEESNSKKYDTHDPAKVTQFIIEPNHNLQTIKYTSRDKVSSKEVIKGIEKQWTDVAQKLKDKFNFSPQGNWNNF
ncbi:MAG: hypothetical protein LBQ05_00665 [Christensenellaceae bacterium]|jgi:hypothetical protein|nr:hypothetical protein [Christensenellaceae bacterium]